MERKKFYFCNAFSLQMIVCQGAYNVKVTPIDKSELPEKENLVSAIGHPDTARVLGMEPNRCNVSLKNGDVIYVAQLVGGRLPEGCTTLPEGFTFRFFKVEIA